MNGGRPSRDERRRAEDVRTELQFGPLDRPVRLSRPRLQTFDYRGHYAYHVVVVVNSRAPVFRDVNLGRWCIEILEAVANDASADKPPHCRRRRCIEILEAVANDAGFELLAFCLMPDHLHLLAQGINDTSHLVTFMQRFKRRTGFHFKQRTGEQLWQPSYFDRVLRKEDDLASVAAYVFQNPVTDGLVEKWEDYLLLGGTYVAGASVGPN